MAKNNDKGRFLEDIVASFHNDENIKIEKRVWLKPLNDPNGEAREIDILLTVNIAGYIKTYIAIECKNYSTQIKPDQINSFKGKLDELNLPVQGAIFVSTIGYSKKAKYSAKKVGITLLTINGLSKDRMSKVMYDAIQSKVYILPVFKSYQTITSIKNPSNNEHLLFFDKDKNYKGTFLDLFYEKWINEKIPLTLGTHNFKIDIPEGWFNLYNGELLPYDSFPVNIEFNFIGYVISNKGIANHIEMLDGFTNEIKKEQIEFNFKNPNHSEIHIFSEEDKLTNFLNSINYKIEQNRIKLPKIRGIYLFYPISKKIKNEYKKFFSNKNRTNEEIEQFLEQIKEMEKDISSVWDT